jgi:hypothetical protein
VKSPMPGACAAAFTVGLPKPRSASHVAASMRSLLEATSALIGWDVNYLVGTIRFDRIESSAPSS